MSLVARSRCPAGVQFCSIAFATKRQPLRAEPHMSCGHAVTGRDKRPIVEFALESAQAVRKMATKQAWQKTQTQGQPGTTALAHDHAMLCCASQ